MKVNRKDGEKDESAFSFSYDDFPMKGVKMAKISEWENGEGYNIDLGDDKIELSNQEIAVLEILFANTRLLK